jgi:hypothetical protein
MSVFIASGGAESADLRLATYLAVLAARCFSVNVADSGNHACCLRPATASQRLTSNAARAFPRGHQLGYKVREGLEGRERWPLS